MKDKIFNFQVPPRLNAVLYFLYQFPDIKDQGHYSRLVEYLLKTHSNKEMAEILDAITWGLKKTDFAFSEQLPNLRKTNDEILTFLSKLNQSILANPEIMKKIELAKDFRGRAQ